MWPFGRRSSAAETTSGGAEAAIAQPSPAAWESLPPLPRTVAPLESTFKIGDRVKEDLVSLDPIRFSSPMTHGVSEAAPAGLVRGLATTPTGQSVQRMAAADELPLRTPKAPSPLARLWTKVTGGTAQEPADPSDAPHEHERAESDAPAPAAREAPSVPRDSRRPGGQAELHPELSPEPPPLAAPVDSAPVDSPDLPELTLARLPSVDAPVPAAGVREAASPVPHLRHVSATSTPAPTAPPRVEEALAPGEAPTSEGSPGAASQDTTRREPDLAGDVPADTELPLQPRSVQRKVRPEAEPTELAPDRAEPLPLAAPPAAEGHEDEPKTIDAVAQQRQPPEQEPSLDQSTAALIGESTLVSDDLVQATPDDRAERPDRPLRLDHGAPPGATISRGTAAGHTAPGDTTPTETGPTETGNSLAVPDSSAAILAHRPTLPTVQRTRSLDPPTECRAAPAGVAAPGETAMRLPTVLAAASAADGQPLPPPQGAAWSGPIAASSPLPQPIARQADQPASPPGGPLPAAPPTQSRPTPPPATSDAGTAAVAAGIAQRMPDGSVVFSPPPLRAPAPSRGATRHPGDSGNTASPETSDRSPVQRIDLQRAAADVPGTPDAHEEDLAAPASELPGQAAELGQSAAAAAAAIAPGDGNGDDTAELVKKMWPDIRWRLRNELRIERERKGQR